MGPIALKKGDNNPEKWDFFKQTINRVEKPISVMYRTLITFEDTLLRAVKGAEKP